MIGLVALGGIAVVLLRGRKAEPQPSKPEGAGAAGISPDAPAAESATQNAEKPAAREGEAPS